MYIAEDVGVGLVATLVFVPVHLGYAASEGQRVQSGMNTNPEQLMRIEYENIINLIDHSSLPFH